MNKLAPLWLP